VYTIIITIRNTHEIADGIAALRKRDGSRHAARAVKQRQRHDDRIIRGQQHGRQDFDEADA